MERNKVKLTRRNPGSRRARQTRAGFSLIELLIAMTVLLAGIVAVAQLVPAAIDFDQRNRYNSVALVVAERELEQMVRQPLTVKTSASVSDYNFADTDGTVVQLGPPPSPATAAVSAAPPAATQSGCPVSAGFIDFTQDCTTTGYVKTVTLAGTSYEVRWNVVTLYGNNVGTIVPVTKRVTIAARSTSVRPLPPVSLSVQVAP